MADAARYLSHWPGNAGYGVGGASARPRSATIVITRNDGDINVAMQGFVDDDLYESARAHMLDQYTFGDVDLDAYIVKVRKRMYRETLAVRVDDGSDVTNAANIYVHIEYADAGQSPAPGTILGKAVGDMFYALDFVWESEDCAALQH